MNITLVLNALSSVLWLLFIALIVVAVLRAGRGRPVKGFAAAILVAAISALLVTTLSAGLVFIQPEERGVVISAVAPKGYREQPLQPGLRWIVPFMESVKTYPISRQTYTMSRVHAEGQVAGDDSIDARTADGQVVTIDASVIFAIDPNQVIQVHIDWQNRYVDELVRPVSRGVIRDAVSQYGVQDVYSTKRGEMTQQISKGMSEALQSNGLTLVEFVLRDISFSPEYAASVEQKQIAEQQAQQAKFVVEQRKQEAEQARQVAQGLADASVIKAKGEAQARLIGAQAESQALDLLAKALQDRPELLQYTFILKMGPGVQTMFLPNNVPYLLPLPSTTPAATPDLNSILPTPQPTPTPLPTPAPTATP
jgi:regulator of protease activity HflC (stomatin/prohibitin superfamily)